MGHLVSRSGSLGADVNTSAIALSTGTGRAFTTDLAEGDAGIAQTIDLMRSLVVTGDPTTHDGARNDPAIRAIAGQLVAPLDPRDQMSHARAIFNWTRDHVRFVRDPANSELVQNPRWTLRFGFGDCDDISTLLATLLESVGIPAAFVTVGLASPDFDHVYVVAMVDGQLIPLDIARVNPQFGVTSPKAFRTHTWPVDPQNTSGDVGRLHGGFTMGALGDDVTGNETYYDPSTDTTFTYDANGQITSYPGLPEFTSGAQQVPTGLSATQIAQLISAGGNSAASVIRAINTPTSPYFNPQSPYYGKTFAAPGLFGIPGLTTNIALLGLGALVLLGRRK